MATEKKSARPTGGAIARSGRTFTFSWKKGATSVSSQMIQWRYRLKGSKVKLFETISTSSSRTSISKSLTADQLAKLLWIEFRARSWTKNTDKVTYTASDWCTTRFEVKELPNPKIIFKLDSSVANKGSFTWTEKVDEKSKSVYNGAEYYTMLLPATVENVTEKSFSEKFAKKNGGTFEKGEYGSGTTSATITFAETAKLLRNPVRRWLKIKVYNVKGSKTAVSSHAYAYPALPTISYARATTNKSGGLQLNIKWSLASTKANPVNEQRVEYAIVTPDSGMKCPSTNWTTAVTYAGAKSNAAIIQLDEILQDDKCIFARLVSIHDENETPSQPKLAAYGKLTQPVIESVTRGQNGFTVNIQRETDVMDSWTEIYISSSKPLLAGKIQHGSYSGFFAYPEGFDTESTDYQVTARESNGTMKSNTTVYNSGSSTPTAPDNITVAESTISGTATLSWEYTWNEATECVISWSDHADAWYSTDAPSTYEVTRKDGTTWNVSGLDTGVEYYFRIKSVNSSGDDTIESGWSDPVSLTLSEVPETPTLLLSDSVIAEGQSVRATWAYSSTSTIQPLAEICTAEVEEGTVTYGDVIASTSTESYIDLSELASGTYFLALRTSTGGDISDWSELVKLTVADPLEMTLASESVTQITITDDDGNTREANALQAMPIVINCTGSGEGGQTIVAIERTESFRAARADNSFRDGFEGETIAQVIQSGEDQITITAGDLIGYLDDGASYRIIATVTDSYGQTSTDEIEFMVKWSHQPNTPTAVVEVDKEQRIAKITATAAEGTVSTDVLDIYRLSVDAPELIVENGVFGETYVDPYPAFAEDAGYRVVCRTETGDCIGADDAPSWVDYETNFRLQDVVIDFGADSVNLEWEVSLSSTWNKSFERTTYLGGSVIGDWGNAVTRNMSVKGQVILDDADDDGKIQKMRQLARYSGLCHIRTSDGSSVPANITVKETQEGDSMTAAFEITVNVVESDQMDGILLSDYEGR